MGRTITVDESIDIAAAPEVVWDFTQDYSRRHEWDRSVTSAEVIRTEPRLVARVRGAALCCELHYKLYERPRRTTLAMTEIESRIVESGGGSWLYEAEAGGTRWTQTNTIILRDGPLLAMFSGFVAWSVRVGTRLAMRRAKRMIERAGR